MKPTKQPEISTEAGGAVEERLSGRDALVVLIKTQAYVGSNRGFPCTHVYISIHQYQQDEN